MAESPNRVLKEIGVEEQNSMSEQYLTFKLSNRGGRYDRAIPRKLTTLACYISIKLISFGHT